MKMNTYELTAHFIPGVLHVTSLSVRIPENEESQDAVTIPIHDLGVIALTAIAAGAIADPTLLRLLKEALNGNVEEAEDWLSSRLLTPEEINAQHSTGGVKPSLIGEEAQEYYGEQEEFAPDAFDDFDD
jgi:hypothetical protein